MWTNPAMGCTVAQWGLSRLFSLPPSDLWTFGSPCLPVPHGAFLLPLPSCLGWWRPDAEGLQRGFPYVASVYVWTRAPGSLRCACLKNHVSSFLLQGGRKKVFPAPTPSPYTHTPHSKCKWWLSAWVLKTDNFLMFVALASQDSCSCVSSLAG